MYIKSKIQLSNILSFLLPLLVGVLSIFLSLRRIDSKYADQDYYKLIEDLERNIVENNSKMIIKDMEELEEMGYISKLEIDGKLIYVSDYYIDYLDQAIELEDINLEDLTDKDILSINIVGGQELLITLN